MGTVSGGYIIGDSSKMSTGGRGGVGGNDYIVVKTLTGTGEIVGDSWEMYHGSRGGNDTIIVGHMGDGGNGADIYGDGMAVYGDSICGDDSITIITMNGGLVYGDAYSATNDNITFGNDTISVGVMDGGIIYGDAGVSGNKATYGNDLIHIGTLNNGRIYGDAPNSGSSVGSTMGNDTIIIDNLAGTGEKLIDGGKGGIDPFIYNNNQGHTIELNDKGQVSIDGNNKYNGTTIINFEGIGGGSANDVLFGNSSDNILIGGKGDDILYGGGEKNSFVWRIDDLAENAHYTDIIKDFSFGDDTIDLSALGLNANDIISSVENNNINLRFTVAGGTQTIVIENGAENLANYNNDLTAMIEAMIHNQEIKLITG